LPTQAGAQPARVGRIDAWIDAGAARVEQPFRAPASAGLVGLGVARTGRTLSLSGQATGTLAGDGLGAGQGLVVASVAPPIFTALRTEVGASLTMFGLASQERGSNGASLLRQSLGWRYGGVFGTLAGSHTRRPLPMSRNALPLERFRATAVDVGLWGRYRWITASLMRQRAWSNDYLVAESTGFGLIRPAASYDFRDLILNTGLTVSGFNVQGTIARRVGGTATRGESRAALLTASVAMTPSLTFVVSGGDALADPLRGTPQFTMTSAALRWRIGGRRTAARADAAVLETRGNGGAVLTVRVRAPSDARVEIASSHGEWIASTMPREEGLFVARVLLPSGTHRVAVRVNGGEWGAPVGLASVRDDLGGSAGLVTVP